MKVYILILVTYDYERREKYLSAFSDLPSVNSYIQHVNENRPEGEELVIKSYDPEDALEEESEMKIIFGYTDHFWLIEEDL